MRQIHVLSCFFLVFLVFLTVCWRRCEISWLFVGPRGSAHGDKPIKLKAVLLPRTPARTLRFQRDSGWSLENLAQTIQNIFLTVCTETTAKTQDTRPLCSLRFRRQNLPHWSANLIKCGIIANYIYAHKHTHERIYIFKQVNVQWRCEHFHVSARPQKQFIDTNRVVWCSGHGHLQLVSIMASTFFSLDGTWSWAAGANKGEFFSEK